MIMKKDAVDLKMDLKLPDCKSDVEKDATII